MAIPIFFDSILISSYPENKVFPSVWSDKFVLLYISVNFKRDALSILSAISINSSFVLVKGRFVLTIKCSHNRIYQNIVYTVPKPMHRHLSPPTSKTTTELSLLNTLKISSGIVGISTFDDA